jgi:hypothetical protein
MTAQLVFLQFLDPNIQNHNLFSAIAPLLSSSSEKIIEGEYIVVFKREASTDEGERERERAQQQLIVTRIKRDH